jgi:3-oxoacyl-[acyl-carrier-protein] synthase III
LIKSEKFANTTAAMIPLALSEAVDLLMISARDSQWVRCCSRGTEE